MPTCPRQAVVAGSQSRRPTASASSSPVKALQLLRVPHLGGIPHKRTFSCDMASHASTYRQAGLPRLGEGGQCLIARPLLEVALELFQRCRCCASCMPNDPYHLAKAPAPTATCRSPPGGGRALAVSTAAVTDHVCNRWHRRPASRDSISRLEDAEPDGGPTTHGICIVPGESRSSQRPTAARERATQPDRPGGGYEPGSRSRRDRRVARREKTKKSPAKTRKKSERWERRSDRGQIMALRETVRRQSSALAGQADMIQVWKRGWTRRSTAARPRGAAGGCADDRRCDPVCQVT